MGKKLFYLLLFSLFFSFLLLAQEKTITIETEPENCQVKVYKWVPFEKPKGKLLIEGNSPLKLPEEKLKDIRGIVIEVSKEGYETFQLNSFSPFDTLINIQLEKEKNIKEPPKNEVFTPSTSNNWTIRATGSNRGFGPYYIGMSAAEFVKNFGRPDKQSNPGKEGYCLTYYGRGLEVGVNFDGTISAFHFYFKRTDYRSIGAGIFSIFPGRTVEGIGPGSTKQDLEKAYGQDYEQIGPGKGSHDFMCSWRNGAIIAFFDIDGKIYLLILQSRTSN